MIRKGILNFFKYFGLGAFMFWAPDFVLHAIRRDTFSGLEVLSLTLFSPSLTCLAVSLDWRANGNSRTFLPAALSAVLGIWLLGPLMMMINASFSYGGFTQPDGLYRVFYSTLIFPLFTFMMSAYDGTLFAVLLATLALPLMSVFLKRKALTPPDHPLPASK